MICWREASADDNEIVDLKPFEGGDFESSPGRTASGRKARKTNALNVMFGTKYRHPDNKQTLMGQEQPLGKAFTVIMHGPDLPTELSLHNEHHKIFMAAVPYAMSKQK